MKAEIKGLSKKEKKMEVYLLWGLGILLIGFGIWTVKMACSCNIEIQAVYLSSTKVSIGRGQFKYAPVFQYEYGGQQYEEQTFQYCSKEYVDSSYLEGEKYKIYICSKNPKQFRVIKKVDFSYIAIILIGICSCVSGFLEMGR